MQENAARSMRVAVIGSGIAGLSVAIRLAAQGHKVSIFERNSYVGGKIFEWKNDGFRFDMGPSVFTMPEHLEELFHVAGKKPEDYLTIIKPEHPFNYFLSTGVVINFFSDSDKLVTELASKTDDSEVSIKRYLENIKAKYDLTKDVFLRKSLHILSNYFSLDFLRGVVNIGKIDAFQSMDQFNRRILKDSNTVSIFNSFASYVGSNPYRAPAVLNVISHVQLGGVFLPVGGIRSIIKALIQLCEDLGIEIYPNSNVNEILVDQGAVNGILVGSDKLYYDIIISGMDAYNVYKQLLPNVKRPSRILDQPKSQSFLIFLWGMKKQFPQLTLHNMFMALDLQGEYDTIQNNADISDDFSIYIYISSKINTEDAPQGCENWYILINAPHLNGQDWDTIHNRIRTKLLQRLSDKLGEEIEPHILFERIRDPRHHEAQTNTAFGAIYGNSFNSRFSVFLRHPNFSSKIKNLYFCGGTVHPGGGIPLSILSSKIVADLIKKKTRLTQREIHP